MATLNSCQFIGNVGKIETRYAPSGEAVTNISLACNESWRDKATNEKKEKTEWVRLSLFGKVAEIAEKFVKVGDPLYASGKLTTRKWQDRDGKDQYTTEIRVDQIQLLGSKESAAPSPQPQRRTPSPSGSGSSGGDDFSDIPFAPIGRGLTGHSI